MRYLLLVLALAPLVGCDSPALMTYDQKLDQYSTEQSRRRHDEAQRSAEARRNQMHREADRRHEEAQRDADRRRAEEREYHLRAMDRRQQANQTAELKRIRAALIYLQANCICPEKEEPE